MHCEGRDGVGHAESRERQRARMTKVDVLVVVLRQHVHDGPERGRVLHASQRFGRKESRPRDGIAQQGYK